MVRLDIVAGLKNAIERGYSLDQAKQTLRNSGYNERDIQEATNYLTGGQINVQQTQQQNYPQNYQQQNYAQQYRYEEQAHNKKFPFLLVFLLLILFVLASFLVLSIVFKEELIIFFKELFG